MKITATIFLLILSIYSYSTEYNRQNMHFYTKHPSGTVIGMTKEGAGILGINIKLVESKVFDELKKTKEIKNLHDFYIRSYKEDERLRLHIDADYAVAGTTRCRFDVYFYIPLSLFNTVNIKQTETVVDCKTGAIIGNVADMFESIVSIALKDSLTKSLEIIEPDDLELHKRADYQWYNHMFTKFSQGKICTIDSTRYFCIFTASGPASSRNAFYLYKDKLIQLSKTYQDRYSSGTGSIAPGPVDIPAAKSSKEKFLNNAIKFNLKPSSTIANYSFPSGCKVKDVCLQEPQWEHTDMMLFGGLLCLSGEERGCELVRKSQTPTGRLARSPDLQNENLDLFKKDKESMFSGDQFLGAVAYFIKTKDLKTFELWMKYIVSTKRSVNNSSDPLTFIYRSCPQEHDNCLLKGNEWYLLSRVADYLGVKTSIPAEEYIDLQGGNPKYNYDIEEWVVDSLIAPPGFRNHLPAVKVFLMEKMVNGNVDISNKLSQIKDILHARQPNNAFLQYIIYGKQAVVQNSLKEQCTLTPNSNRRDWAWQRADIYESAKNESMQWDCVFMYNLLLN